MAVFLMKSKLGAAETPPPATGMVFSDVPASDLFAHGSSSSRGSRSPAVAAGASIARTIP
jgi:hypothetical protein